MLPRRLPPPETSFFLLGARSTGKTAWIEHHFSEAESYDLLLSSESLRLSRDPGLLRHECETKKKHRFVLSGSSARKLRRSGVNLLAGRAEMHNMFPLVCAETGTTRPLDDTLATGMLG